MLFFIDTRRCAICKCMCLYGSMLHAINIRFIAYNARNDGGAGSLFSPWRPAFWSLWTQAHMQAGINWPHYVNTQQGRHVHPETTLRKVTWQLRMSTISCSILIMHHPGLEPEYYLQTQVCMTCALPTAPQKQLLADGIWRYLKVRHSMSRLSQTAKRVANILLDQLFCYNNGIFRFYTVYFSPRFVKSEWYNVKQRRYLQWSRISRHSVRHVGCRQDLQTTLVRWN